MKRWEAIRNWFASLFWKHPEARQVEDLAYVKAQIPRSTFTKALTPYRKWMLLNAMRGMTQGQLRIVQSRGWDRGLLEKSADGSLRCRRM